MIIGILSNHILTLRTEKDWRSIHNLDEFKKLKELNIFPLCKKYCVPWIAS